MKIHDTYISFQKYKDEKFIVIQGWIRHDQSLVTMKFNSYKYSIMMQIKLHVQKRYAIMETRTHVKFWPHKDPSITIFILETVK